jgi:hypothetical protein
MFLAVGHRSARRFCPILGSRSHRLRPRLIACPRNHCRCFGWSLPCYCWPILTPPPPVRDGGQVVVLNNPSCDRAVVLSPPRLRLKLPWDASCSSGVGLPLLPPQHGLFGRCSSGDAQVVARSSLYVVHHMKVVKSVKMKPHEVTLLVLMLFRVVFWRLRQFVLQVTKRFRGSSPNSKFLCMSPRKSEGFLLQLVHRRARRIVLRLRSFLLVVGHIKFHE